MNIYLGDEIRTKKFLLHILPRFQCVQYSFMNETTDTYTGIAVYNNNSNLHLVEGTKKTKN